MEKYSYSAITSSHTHVEGLAQITELETIIKNIPNFSMPVGYWRSAKKEVQLKKGDKFLDGSKVPGWLLFLTKLNTRYMQDVQLHSINEGLDVHLIMLQMFNGIFRAYYNSGIRYAGIRFSVFNMIGNVKIGNQNFRAGDLLVPQKTKTLEWGKNLAREEILEKFYSDYQNLNKLLSLKDYLALINESIEINNFLERPKANRVSNDKLVISVGVTFRRDAIWDRALLLNDHPSDNINYEHDLNQNLLKIDYRLSRFRQAITKSSRTNLLYEYYNEGLINFVDICGQETSMNLNESSIFLKELEEKSIPVYIHAGETNKRYAKQGLSNCNEVLNYLNIKGIGHCYRAFDWTISSYQVLENIIKSGRVIEMIPTSLKLTGVEPKIKNNRIILALVGLHPLLIVKPNLYNQFIHQIVIADDDRSTGIELKAEYEQIKNRLIQLISNPGEFDARFINSLKKKSQLLINKHGLDNQFNFDFFYNGLISNAETKIDELLNTVEDNARNLFMFKANN